MKNKPLLALFLLVMVGVFGRLIPHLPNFTPVAAIALFAGYYFPNKRYALIAVLGIMVISDVFIGGYDPRLMAVVYGALLFPLIFRTFLQSRLSTVRVAASVFIGSIVFFLTTNLAVWLFSGLYAKTLTGLIECYTLAIPFFKYTLAGDLVWASIIFGAYAFMMHRTPQPQTILTEQLA